MQKSWILAVSLLAVLVMLISMGAVACNGNGDANGTPPNGDGNGAPPDGVELEIASPAFEDGGTIPADYTCEGQNISPPLEWDWGPTGTRSFALIVDDPYAPDFTFTHWVIFNIPAHIVGLERR